MSAEVDASTHADHAHVDGKCTSWVDEALDAAGPEYADAPRPGSCCEKDAKAAAEAARVRRIVSAADPVRKAEALRRSSDPRFATRDAATLGAQELVDEAASSDLDSDDLLTDSDGEDPASTRFARTTDPHLLEIQEKRIREMKLAAARAAERAAAARARACWSYPHSTLPPGRASLPGGPAAAGAPTSGRRIFHLPMSNTAWHGRP